MNDILSLYVFPFVFLATITAFMGMVKGLRKYSIIGVVSIFIATILLLVLRDPLAPADSVNYLWMYNEQSSFNNVFTAYHGNVFFSFTQYIGNLLNLEAKTFFIYQTIGFYILTFLALKLIFESNKMLLTALSLFVLTSTFVLLFTNVIRQGLALALILFATGLFLRKYRVSGYIVLSLAVFSHFSAIIIASIYLFVRIFKMKTSFLFLLIVLMPITPIISKFMLSNLSSLGGFFYKIESFSSNDYGNFLVYIKVLILYLSLVLFYFYGINSDLFNNYKFTFMFKVYLMIVAVVAFTLPVLLLSSRYLYYASAYLPILFTFILYQKKNVFSLEARFYVGFSMALTFGFFVYNFQSVRMQLGI